MQRYELTFQSIFILKLDYCDMSTHYRILFLKDMNIIKSTTCEQWQERSNFDSKHNHWNSYVHNSSIRTIEITNEKRWLRGCIWSWGFKGSQIVIWQSKIDDEQRLSAISTSYEKDHKWIARPSNYWWKYESDRFDRPLAHRIYQQGQGNLQTFFL